MSVILQLKIKFVKGPSISSLGNTPPWKKKRERKTVSQKASACALKGGLLEEERASHPRHLENRQNKENCIKTPPPGFIPLEGTPRAKERRGNQTTPNPRGGLD